MTVGVYASPMPGDSVIPGARVLVVRSQRYSLPSSLLARTDLVNGSTAAVLMHHSRTALGNCARCSGSGVTPAMLRISFITSWPLRRGMRLHHGVVGIEHRHPVHAVPAVEAGVVVVLGEDQIGGRAAVRRHRGGRHDGGGAVPAEAAGRLGLGEVGGEVQHPAADVEGVAEDAVVDVAVRADHGRCGAVVDDVGVVDAAVAGILQRDAHLHPGRRLLEGQGRRIQADQVVIRGGVVTRHDDVQGVLVVAQGRRRLVRHAGDVRVAARRGHRRDPAAVAVGIDARDAARADRAARCRWCGTPK